MDPATLLAILFVSLILTGYLVGLLVLGICLLWAISWALETIRGWYGGNS